MLRWTWLQQLEQQFSGVPHPAVRPLPYLADPPSLLLSLMTPTRSCTKPCLHCRSAVLLNEKMYCNGQIYCNGKIYCDGNILHCPFEVILQTAA